jgi:hypothetical protein
MMSYRFAFILLVVVTGASASTNAAPRQARPLHIAFNQSANMNPSMPQASLADLSGNMAREMRAISVFGQQHVVDTKDPDTKLMVLAALGLVILQLRRKHKSLPQRRIGRLLPIADL